MTVLTFNGSSGEIDCDESGKVLAIRHDDESDPAYDGIVRLDLAERQTWWSNAGLPLPDSGLVDGDVLDCGGWDSGGTYFPACIDIRNQWLAEKSK